MNSNAPSAQLYDLLITKNFDVDALDAATGKPPINQQGSPDIEAANMFSFDWVPSSGKNYGTVVALIGADNNFEVYFGDNIGRTMDFDDKQEWYDFLSQLRQYAKRNLLRYDLKNLNRLKYTMQGMATVTEGLFESFYGNKKVSYSGEPTGARLVIKHNRTLGENDARYRYIDSLFIETVDGERFKLPFRKLAGGRAMLEHVRLGGNPYDVRGQHICEMVSQINILGQFKRAQHGRVFEGVAAELVEQATTYYKQVSQQLKELATTRGYSKYFESWNPVEITNTDYIVEDLKDMFVEVRLDPRIEQALPLMASFKQGTTEMKEIEIFESWVHNLGEGTWALPDTPEKVNKLKQWMSQPQAVGPDAAVTEELYDLIGDDQLYDRLFDLANQNPDADAVPVVKDWINNHRDNFEELSSLSQTIEVPDNTEPAVGEADNLATFESIEELKRMKTLAIGKQ